MPAPLLPAAAPTTAGHRVRIGAAVFGGAAVPVIAGPCAVEPGYADHAAAAAAAGAGVLRGCIHKPRTRPESFQGLGAAGLPLLDAARSRTGLAILAEPLQPEDIDSLRGHADALLLGARSMHNTPLLRAAGRSGMPVVLKRGLAATYDEWLGAADYVLGEGNPDVILCERGIRTFETTTRNTLDVGAIPVLREPTRLPVIVDPSHAAGTAAWVPALALAALAAGADGLLVESHPTPAAAWSDAAQAVTPAVLAEIVVAADLVAALTRRPGCEDLAACRESIDAVDSVLGLLLERRAELVERAQEAKRDGDLPARDPAREAVIAERLARRAPRLGLAGAAAVMTAVVEACLDATAAVPA